MPPDQKGDITDEEKDDEDITEHQVLEDVAGEVEVFHSSLETNEQEEVTESSSRPAKRTKSAKVSWKKNRKLTTPLPSGTPRPLEKTQPQLSNYSPFDLFRWFYDKDVCSLIVTELERYAKQKLDHTFTLPYAELDVFLATVLLSGYNKLSQETLYWSNDEDVGIELVKRKMSRNRFQEIKKYLHLADNDHLPQNDKLGKVKDSLQLMKRNFIQFGVFCHHISIDERMVPYYGHLLTKMFMRNKLVKFGMNIWFLTSSEGYPFSFQVYTGKDDSVNGPLGKRVVKTLTAVVEDNSNHSVYFDNFFSSTSLCRDLADKKLKCTGTIRQNRTQSCPLTHPSAMKKNERGVFETFGDGKVALCQWNYKRPVCLVSNFQETEPTSMARRWSATQRSYVYITQPHVVNAYNKYMGGVDLLDRFLSEYRPRLRSKKW